MFRNLVAGVLVASAFAVFPAAAENISAERETAMKDIGRNFGVVNRMNRGQNPYDGTAATEAFSHIAGSGRKFAVLFPERDDESEAGRMVAQDRARFDGLMKDFIADAAAAAETAGEGEESLKQAFRSVAANCSACHKVFRPD